MSITSVLCKSFVNLTTLSNSCNSLHNLTYTTKHKITVITQN